MLESTRKAVPAPKKDHHQNRNFILQIETWNLSVAARIGSRTLFRKPELASTSSTSRRKTGTVLRLVFGDFGGVFLELN